VGRLRIAWQRNQRLRFERHGSPKPCYAKHQPLHVSSQFCHNTSGKVAEYIRVYHLVLNASSYVIRDCRYRIDQFNGVTQFPPVTSVPIRPSSRPCS
jgi:hypothetical protein